MPEGLTNGGIEPLGVQGDEEDAPRHHADAPASCSCSGASAGKSGRSFTPAPSTWSSWTAGWWKRTNQERFQAFLLNRTRTGRISKRPIIMHMESTTLDRGEKLKLTYPRGKEAPAYGAHNNTKELVNLLENLFMGGVGGAGVGGGGDFHADEARQGGINAAGIWHFSFGSTSCNEAALCVKINLSKREGSSSLWSSQQQARQGGVNSAGQERKGDEPVIQQPDACQHQQDDKDHHENFRDRGILPPQVGVCAGTNGGSQFS